MAEFLNKEENKELLKGERGIRGSRGIQGDKGEKGDLGPRGPIGISYMESFCKVDPETKNLSLGNINNFGKSNVYMGTEAGLNEKSDENVYIGNNTGTLLSGGLNTFIGSESGKLSSGSHNTYIGNSVCSYTGSDGSYNTFLGSESGYKNEKGVGNLFAGAGSGSSNKDGSWNVFLGQSAGQSNELGTNNVFIGANSAISSVNGNSCIIIGDNSDTFGNTPVNQIVIGQGVVSYGDNSITFPKNLKSFPNGVEVCFSSASGGCLFPVSSSLKWKTNIEDIEKNIDTSKIYDLNPVTYNSVNGDPKETHIGLIAEDVDKLFPELVPKDEEGNPSSVKYSLLSVVLIAELKKLKKEIDDLKSKLNSV
jgi:hypothetical protein